MTKTRWKACGLALLAYSTLTACKPVDDTSKVNEPTASPVPRSRTYTVDADFNSGTLHNANHDAPNNHQLQLNQKTSIAPYLWVANWRSGTVTKINTRTGRQVAKYYSVLERNWDGTRPTVQPLDPITNTGARNKGGDLCGNSPSRTAVDAYGDAYVANRAFCSRPSATKYAGDLSRCVDRNGNGQIDTSRDVNDDKVIDINDPAEFKGQADECILWTKNYGAPDSLDTVGRSIAVDSDQNVWVGTYTDSRLFKLDGQTGAQLQALDPNAERGTTANIYGIALGPGGFIYTSDLGAGLLRKIDPNPTVRKHVVDELKSDYPTYGIAVDSKGVVWLGKWTDTDGGLVRVDFDARRVTYPGKGTVEGCTGKTRGVAVDGEGNVWTACWNGDVLLKFDKNGYFRSWPVGAGPIGVSIDADGKVWTVDQTTQTATQFDPTTNKVSQSVLTSDETYSYSDMTGFQQRHMGVRQGHWTAVHDSGIASTRWGKVTWNTESQGSTPQGTSIIVEVRAADDSRQLGARPFVAVSNGVDFGDVVGLDVVGRYVEIRATLKSHLDSQDTDTSPVLSDLSIKPANLPPVAICKAANVCTEPGVCFANASIDNGSYDPDGDPITLTQSPPGPYSLGSRDVTLVVSDGRKSDTCTAPVTVRDCEPPVITTFQVELWPPNHKMHSFTLSSCATAIDTCEGTIDVNAAGTITTIYSDEPEDVKGNGDGNTTGDIVITGPNSFSLRAERQGGSNGRVYGVNFRVSDTAGNVASGTCRFVVPHDQSGRPTVDDGPGKGYTVIRF